MNISSEYMRAQAMSAGKVWQVKSGVYSRHLIDAGRNIKRSVFDVPPIVTIILDYMSLDLMKLLEYETISIKEAHDLIQHGYARDIRSCYKNDKMMPYYALLMNNIEPIYSLFRNNKKIWKIHVAEILTFNTGAVDKFMDHVFPKLPNNIDKKILESVPGARALGKLVIWISGSDSDHTFTENVISLQILALTKWAYNRGLLCRDTIISYAAIHSDLEIIKWLCENGAAKTNIAFFQAIKKDRVDVVDYMYSVGFPYNSKSTFCWAVRGGAYNTVDWLIKNNFICDEYTFTEAVNSIKMMSKLHSYRCPYNKEQLLKNSRSTREWIEENL